MLLIAHCYLFILYLIGFYFIIANDLSPANIFLSNVVNIMLLNVFIIIFYILKSDSFILSVSGLNCRIH